MKILFSFCAAALACASVVSGVEAKAEMNYFLKNWQAENAPALLLKEIEPGEWGMNKPYFFRHGFSGDGPTKLHICRVVLSSEQAHKPGTLVLFECRSDERPNVPPSTLPWWLVRISAETPAVPLNTDGSALYIYGEDTYYLHGSTLLKHSHQLRGIWKDMAEKVIRYSRQ